MTAETKTVIGQLNIAGGTWRRDAPNQVAVREPQTADRPGAGKGDLFILTEVRGGVTNRQAVEQRLAETIRDAYYLSRGAVTASLRRALQTTNNHLYQHNSQVEPNERIIAGVVVLVVRRNEVFVAQIGPAAFYAVLRNLIRRYPTDSAWLAGTAAPDEPALGSKAIIEPNLHHLQVASGDMLLLADSQLASRIDLNTIVRAVVPGQAKATIKNLGKTAGQVDCSALALAVINAERSTFATLRENTPSQISRLLNRHRNPQSEDASFDGTAPEPDDQTVETDPQMLTGWLTRLAKKPDRGPTKPSTRSTYREQKDQFLEEEPVYAEADLSHGRVMDSVAHDSGFHPEFERDHATKSSFSVGKILRWVSAGVLLLVALLGNGLKNILRMVLPQAYDSAPRQAGAQIYRGHSSAVSWKMLRNIVIVIPVIVTLIVAISYIQKGRLREAEYTQFLTTAQEKFQQAQAVAADPGSALGLMAEAEKSLVEAETIKGVQPEITGLREQMQQFADQIGQVQRFFYLPVLRQYTEAGTSLRDITVEGVEVYVLDTGTDRIFHHQIDDLGETLLPDDDTLLLAAKGQQVDNLVVGDLIGATWMPTGGNRQTSDLVVLNSNGLLEYNPTWGITTSALANGEALVNPVAVSSYFGNFYVLDPTANRLLRYLPTADGYNAPPESYFPADQPLDLSKAVDLAIDGAVYVLFNDGRISKFQAGVPAPFEVIGLDKPLNNPVSIFTAPDEDVQYVYVADAGNQRIIQLEKDGRFVRQFKPGLNDAITFANLQDIFVDELSGRIFILDSNNLYVSNIPTAGE
jgi:hypothetical protein